MSNDRPGMRKQGTKVENKCAHQNSVHQHRARQTVRSGKAEGGHSVVPQDAEIKNQVEYTMEPISINAERSGDWMAADELRRAAMGALEAGKDVSLNLAGIHHLDASALQILLASEAAAKRQGRQIELANASAELRQWFEYAGAAEIFFSDGARTR